MDSGDNFFLLFLAAVCAGVFAVIIGGAMLLDSATCSAASAKMQFRSDWGPLQGCMVEYKPGKWIAISKYRAFDE